jgi:hypothetical protein
MSEAAVLDVAALDASASAVETDSAIPELNATPDAETPEVPAVEADSAADKTKTETTAEKPVDAAKTLTDAVAAFTPKDIVGKLSEIKKTDPALATRLHQEVKNSLEAKRFLAANNAKTFNEVKALLSKPDETTEQFRQSVETTDELLYRGDLKELSGNILDDITAELGDKEGPARLSELTEHLFDKLKEVNAEGHTRIQRAQFLAASTDSGLLKSLNSLHTLLFEGKTSEAQKLLKSIGTFFNEELKAAQDVTAKVTAENADSATKTTAAVTALRTEVTSEVTKTTNEVMGAFLRPFLSAQLKGVPRPDLIKAAEAIKSGLDQYLGKDGDWVKIAEAKWNALKTPANKREIMRLYTEKVKSGLGAKVVDATLRRLFPDKFKAPTPRPAAPASTQVTIGGKSQTVFQFAKRPTNLVRSDTEVAGRIYTSKDLQLLQLSKGIGLVPNKSGKGHSFVQWKR